MSDARIAMAVKDRIWKLEAIATVARNLNLSAGALQWLGRETNRCGMV
jgi:hypothetical protein